MKKAGQSGFAPSKPGPQFAVAARPDDDFANMSAFDDLGDSQGEGKFMSADQGGLTEAQLDEKFSKVITATDPNVSRTRVRYHYNLGMYRIDPNLNHLAVHFFMEGNLVRPPASELKAEGEAAAAAAAETERRNAQAQAGEPDMEDNNNSSSSSSSSAISATPIVLAEPHVPVPVKNQFNYTQRAMHTFNPPTRNRIVTTEPPPRVDCHGEVTQWSIFDAYKADLLAQQSAKEQKDGGRGPGSSGSIVGSLPRTRDEDDPTATASDDGDVVGSGSSSLSTTSALSSSSSSSSDPWSQNNRLLRALKVMERTVTQTELLDTYYAFKFSDEVKSNNSLDSSSSLSATISSLSSSSSGPSNKPFALWSFGTPSNKSNQRSVTAISWNKHYSDLFAVGYGLEDYAANASKSTIQGAISCYSLKNTLHPEATVNVPSSVLSLDWHPSHPSLIVAGLHDGTVCVFDMQRVSKTSVPLFSSTDPKTKHTGPVWQVAWNEDPINLNFYSLSSDGCFANWTVNRNELDKTVMVMLKYQTVRPDNLTPSVIGTKKAKDMSLVALSGGTCFDFNTTLDMVVIGTEDGALCTYETAHNCKFSLAFEGHTMTVYSVKWNQFHPTVFLSCAADNTVKIWEYSTKNPAITIDAIEGVDAMWAPNKATSFGVVLLDGTLQLYDLTISKKHKIASWTHGPNIRLTHLAYNPRESILAVSDILGSAIVLKLPGSIWNIGGHVGASIEDLDPLAEQAALENVLIIQDEYGNNKVTKSIPPRMALKKLEEKLAAEKKAAELAAAKKAEQEMED